MRVRDGMAFRGEDGHLYRVHGVIGEGLSVSSDPSIASAQREGPPMALLVRVDRDPHIFDWIGVGVLERDYVPEPDHDLLPLLRRDR